MLVSSVLDVSSAPPGSESIITWKCVSHCEENEAVWFVRCVFVLQRHVWTHNVCLLSAIQSERPLFFCEKEKHRRFPLCASCGCTWTPTKQPDRRTFTVAELQQVVDLSFEGQDLKKNPEFFRIVLLLHFSRLMNVLLFRNQRS